MSLLLKGGCPSIRTYFFFSPGAHSVTHRNWGLLNWGYIFPFSLLREEGEKGWGRGTVKRSARLAMGMWCRQWPSLFPFWFPQRSSLAVKWLGLLLPKVLGEFQEERDLRSTPEMLREKPPGAMSIEYAGFSSTLWGASQAHSLKNKVHHCPWLGSLIVRYSLQGNNLGKRNFGNTPCHCLDLIQ